MDEPRDKQNECDTLLSQLLDDQSTDETWSRLQNLLHDDPVMQDDYLASIALHSELVWRHESAPSLGETLADELELSTAESGGRWRRTRQTLYDVASNYITLSLLISSIVMAIIVLSLGLIEPGRNKQVPSSPDVYVVAEITSTHEATFDESSIGNFQNRSLFKGETVVLNSGLVEVAYDSGARVVLEGPVTYRIFGTNSGYLQVGKLVARIESEQAKGFSVDTPQARVVDLGTEFGVKVDANGQTTASVLDGKIAFYQRTSDGIAGNGLQLVKGETAHTNEDLATVVRTSKVPRFSRTASRQRGAYELAVLADKPIVYWRFEERAGAIVKDQSGNQLHAALTGNYQRTTGANSLGQTLLLDGSGAARCADNDQLRITGPITIEAWIRRDGIGKAWERIVEKDFQAGYILAVNPADTGEFDLTPGHALLGLNGLFAESDVPVTDGEWHHVVTTWDGEKMLVYVDGRPGNAVEFAGPIGVSSHPVTIGARSFAIGQERFSGEIDEIAIYDRCLDATEIRLHRSAAGGRSDEPLRSH